MRRLALLFLLSLPLAHLFAEEVLRARIDVELEPVWAVGSALPYPLDARTASREALSESALYFSGTIYGWRYLYEPGEKARAIAEALDLESQGSIAWGDDRLTVVSTSQGGSVLTVWTEYRLDPSQQRYRDSWLAADTKSVQANGNAPLSTGPGDEAAATGRQDALKDAARAAIRSWLRAWERNRPREVRGRIALAATPRFWIDAGHWVCAARFRLTVESIVPFSAY